MCGVGFFWRREGGEIRGVITRISSGGGGVPCMTGSTPSHSLPSYTFLLLHTPISLLNSYELQTWRSSSGTSRSYATSSSTSSISPTTPATLSWMAMVDCAPRLLPRRAATTLTESCSSGLALTVPSSVLSSSVPRKGCHGLPRLYWNASVTAVSDA